MRWIATLMIALAFTPAINAQKLYTTKTGNISFESRTPLEDIDAKNSEVESKLLSSTGQVTFALLMKGFRFENELMEEHFNENYVESDKFPKADFKGTITNIKDINFTKDGTYPAKVKGSLTIHGVTKDIETNGAISVKNGNPSATSQFIIKLKDYNIGGGVIGKKIAETITIKVDCRYQ